MIDRSSRRRFGQNYLIDKSVIFQIVDKINPGIEDDFIEIGPGQGAITKSIKNNSRERRFIIYRGIVEASKVPQEWNAWLHHVSNDLPKKTSKKSWMKDHLPNMTGTPYAYEYKDQKKSDKVKNIYSIWKPDEN